LSFSIAATDQRLKARFILELNLVQCLFFIIIHWRCLTLVRAGVN